MRPILVNLQVCPPETGLAMPLGFFDTQNETVSADVARSTGN